MNRKQVHARLAMVGLILATMPVVISAQEKKPQRLDRYGDSLPSDAIARLGTVRLRHGGSVCSAAFSPDGKTLATGSTDHTARIWDVATGSEIRRFKGHRAAVSAVAISPDGNLLATAGACHFKGGGEHSVRVWDLGTGRLIRLLDRGDEKGSDLSGHYLSFSFDGKLLVSGSDRSIILWDVGTGKERIRRTIKEGEIHRVVFSRDGALLALGSQGNAALLWDARTGKPIQRFLGHREVGGFAAVRSLSLSPDGKTLATGGVDETIRLWDVATGKQLRQMEGHGQHVDGVIFTRDGKILASGSLSESAVRLWDASTGKQLRVLRQSKGELAFAFSPDGKLLATGAYDQTIRLWDTASGRQREMGGHESDVLSVAFRADGEQMASVGRDGTYRLWRRTSGAELRCSRVGSTLIRRASLSANGGRVAMLDGQEKDFVTLWDVGAEVKRLRPANIPEQLCSAALSPDGRTLLAGDLDGRLYLWDLSQNPNTKPVVHSLAYPEEERGSLIDELLFSPDGKRVVVGYGDDVRLADLAVLKIARRQTKEGELARPISFNSSKGCLALSGDGSLLAVGGWWDYFRTVFWIKEEHRENQPAVSLCRTARPHSEPRDFGINRRGEAVTALAFSPDGKTLAAARNDGTIQLWVVASGKVRRSLAGHQGPIHQLVFSADGKWLASAGADTTILIWDMAGTGDNGLKQRNKP